VTSIWILFLLALQEPDPFETGLKQIDSDSMKPVLEKLASDDFEGRRTGSPGIRKAREYIISEMKGWGVQPTKQGYELSWKTCSNIGAVYEGSDPQWKKEYLILGSHYDHLGRALKPEGDDFINNGADDNASGTTLNLFVAKALATSKIPLKRSILHLWFSGEEQGLNGAKSYCQEPLIPLSQIVAMVNCDMVGRPPEKGASLFGVGSSLQFEPCGSRAKERVPGANVNLVEAKGSLFHRSDQNVFWSRGVSVMFLFGTMHADYHRVTDHSDRIDYPQLAELTKFVLALIVELANSEDKIERNPNYK